MNICVLVPSEEYLNQAGVRIRYRRIAGSLDLLGHEIAVTPIDRFTRPGDFTHDVYIFSKVYDARSLVVARLLAGSGKRLGIDLFDDYFSQTGDSRFVRLRRWLNTLVRSVHFILCSTEQMRQVAQRIAPDLPIHVMDDPSPPLDVAKVSTSLQHKRDRALQSNRFTIAWFGIGDNPHFPVGLADLAAWSGTLAAFRGRRFDVRLAILTNRRALQADSLAALRRLPLPYRVEEWTEAREAELLARCLVCFLPVNAQNFSIAKSLNRAVSALTAGAQVLSSGYPLYEVLGPLIYRDPVKLLDDLESGQLALREESLPDLARLVSECADPTKAAQDLVGFLEGLPMSPGGPPPSVPIAVVIHGKQTAAHVHQTVQRLGGLSVASPFAPGKLKYDISCVLENGGPGLSVYVSKKCGARLASEVQRHLSPAGATEDGIGQRLNVAALDPESAPANDALPPLDTAIGAVASYTDVMQSVSQLIEGLFPDVPQFVSEHSGWPLFPARPAGPGGPP